MFILFLYTSSFIFQPRSLTVIPFETKELCEQTLVQAKKEWVTMDTESKCVDVQLEAEIKQKEQELRQLRQK